MALAIMCTLLEINTVHSDNAIDLFWLFLYQQYGEK